MKNIIGLLLSFAATSAMAANGQVTLTGSVTPQCDITNSVTGVLSVTSGGTVLQPTTQGSVTLVTNTTGLKLTPAAATLTKGGVAYTDATIAENLVLTGPSGTLTPDNAGVFDLSQSGNYMFVSGAVVTATTGTLPIGTYTVSIPFSCAL